MAAAAHLWQADPTLQVSVIDPAGQWLSTWYRQFEMAEIEWLRSPVVHHPAPDPFALERFMRNHDLPRSGQRYELPLTEVFAKFCRALIAHMNLANPIAARPTSIRSDGEAVIVELPDQSLRAGHLIVATNSHRRPRPAWVDPLLGQHPGLITHGLDIDLPALPALDGVCVAIVGGGITAGHLAVGAAARGAAVHLISRETLRIRDFDTDPGWLGPRFLDAFNDEPDPSRRLSTAQEARNGGSVPDWMHTQLSTYDGPGSIRLHEASVVRQAAVRGDARCVLQLSDGSVLNADRLWLATGTQADVATLRCLRPLLDDVVTQNGVPLVGDDLRLGPHPAFVMGRLAMAALGPAAGNLWGAQRAARRITDAIAGVDLTARDKQEAALHLKPR